MNSSFYRPNRRTICKQYLSFGNSVIMFDRAYIGKLEKYNPGMEWRYGTKQELKKRLEEYYGVTLGKYVRHVAGEVIIFFANKVGLTGGGWAERTWKIVYNENPFWEGQLLTMLPGSDVQLTHSAYRFRYKAFGMTAYKEYFECEGPTFTYLYFAGSLYTFSEADKDGWIELYKVPMARTKKEKKNYD